jgi:hypothetical protein
MSSLQLRYVAPAGTAESVEGTWSNEGAYSNDLRLLERRVTAARFGVNSPRKPGARSGRKPIFARIVPAHP